MFYSERSEATSRGFCPEDTVAGFSDRGLHEYVADWNNLYGAGAPMERAAETFIGHDMDNLRELALVEDAERSMAVAHAAGIHLMGSEASMM